MLGHRTQRSQYKGGEFCLAQAFRGFSPWLVDFKTEMVERHSRPNFLVTVSGKQGREMCQRRKANDQIKIPRSGSCDPPRHTQKRAPSIPWIDPKPIKLTNHFNHNTFLCSKMFHVFFSSFCFCLAIFYSSTAPILRDSRVITSILMLFFSCKINALYRCKPHPPQPTDPHFGSFVTCFYNFCSLQTV